MTFDEWLKEHPESSRRQAWEAGFAEGRGVVTGSAKPRSFVLDKPLDVFGKIMVTEDMVGKIIIGKMVEDPRKPPTITLSPEGIKAPGEE